MKAQKGRKPWKWYAKNGIVKQSNSQTVAITGNCCMFFALLLSPLYHISVHMGFCAYLTYIRVCVLICNSVPFSTCRGSVFGFRFPRLFICPFCESLRLFVVCRRCFCYNPCRFLLQGACMMIVCCSGNQAKKKETIKMNFKKKSRNKRTFNYNCACMATLSHKRNNFIVGGIKLWQKRSIRNTTIAIKTPLFRISA